MLNNKLLFSPAKRILKFNFDVTVGDNYFPNDNYHDYGFINYEIVNDHYQTYGAISPNTFLNSSIKDLSSSIGATYGGVDTDSISLNLWDDKDVEGVGSTIKITRTDTGKSFTLGYTDNKDYAIWSCSLLNGETFFEASDVGKTIPILIEYTPPQAKALFSGFIKATKGWLHSLCASLFASVEVVNA